MKSYWKQDTYLLQTVDFLVSIVCLLSYGDWIYNANIGDVS